MLALRKKIFFFLKLAVSLKLVAISRKYFYKFCNILIYNFYLEQFFLLKIIKKLSLLQKMCYILNIIRGKEYFYRIMYMYSNTLIQIFMHSDIFSQEYVIVDCHMSPTIPLNLRRWSFKSIIVFIILLSCCKYSFWIKRYEIA